jgi:hypothetical protein
MRSRDPATASVSWAGVSLGSLSGRRLALLVGPLVGLLVAQVIDSGGPGPLAAAVGAVIAAALLLSVSRRLDLTLLPVILVLPLAGYLTILWPERGFSLVFDLAVVGPFLLLLLRKLAWPTGVRMLDRGWWPVWGFLLVVLLQALNPEGAGWLVNLQGFRRNVLPMLLFFVAVNVDLSRPASLRRMAWLSMAAAVVVAVWGLKQRFVGLDAAEQLHAASVGTLWLAGTENNLRIFSTMRVPWAFAAYMAAMGLIAVSLAVAVRTWLGRLLACGVAVLFGVTLLFTLMRGAMVGYLAGLALLLAAGLAGPGRAAVLRALLLFAGATLAVGSAVALTTVMSASDDVVVQRWLTLAAPLSDEAMLDRLFAWKGAGDIIADHPLGLGLGTTSGVSARYEELLPTAAIHADNLYVAAFVETGWLGGALLVSLSMWSFVRGRHLLHRNHGAPTWLPAGVLASLLALTVASLATPVLWEPATSQLYWMLVGVVVNLAERCPCRRPLLLIPRPGR